MKRLTGLKPLITRSADDAGDWVAALTAEGAEPIVLPCIRSETIDDPALEERLSAAIAHGDWLIFTSRRGVDACAALHGRDLPAGLRIATVGAATAERVGQRLVQDGHAASVERIGSGTAADLARELASEPTLTPGCRCVLALAANAGNALERTLRRAGASVERFDVYRTVPAEPTGARQPLSALGCDSVLFASPSAVTGFDNQVTVDLAAQIVTIGPSTSAAVRARRWNVTAQATEPSLSGIIDCLSEKNRV